jgi:chromosomal replication initiator protein
LAFAATQRIAECPGTNYNPLFIYGGVGLGKTHLMHAVGNKMLQNNPNCKILCVSAQNFMNDFTTAVRENTYDQFNNKYHNVDALFIDDVQYLCGDKRQIQNKLFEAFEKLVPYGKQIIFTSDTYARSLKAMDERLISRFTSGLSVEVEPPELETRAMILQKKAMTNNFNLPDDVAFFIAKHLKSNVRELEGALQRLMAYHMFRSAGPVTVEMAREALHSILISSTAQLTVERIQGVVAEYFKISLADMYSKRRLKSIVVPRQIAMYLCKELTKSSLPDIGDRFGKRDHTTVLHAVQKITAYRKTDSDLNYKIHVLEQMLKN